MSLFYCITQCSGTLARIFLFPTASQPCNAKISETIIESLKDNMAIGELEVEDNIFGDDFSPIKVPNSAFQGDRIIF